MTRRKLLACRQANKLIASIQEECTTADKQCANSLLGNDCKGPIEIAFVADVQENNLQPQGARDVRQSFRSRFSLHHKRVVKYGGDANVGNERVQQFQPFGFDRTGEEADACDVAPGRLMLATSPTLTGSLPFTNKIGIVVVAAFAARAVMSFPGATIAPTCRRTKSAASAGSRSR